jgi:hypothetical protein
MTRDEIEARLRELGRDRRADPGEPAMRALAERVWEKVRARPRRRPWLWWSLAPLAVGGAAAALLLRAPAPTPLPGPLPQSAADLDDAGARKVLDDLGGEMNEDLREFEQTLLEPASTDDMLAGMNETQLRALADALRKEKKG